MGDPGGGQGEAGLEQIEEDIRLCEQFLNTNTGPAHGSSPRQHPSLLVQKGELRSMGCGPCPLC